MIICDDALKALRTLPDNSVQCCVTSPPYWGLRDYNTPGQLGLEKSPKAYIVKMVRIFREVRRVLKPDGTLWLNMGDSYAGSWGAQGRSGGALDRRNSWARQIAKAAKKESGTGSIKNMGGLKPKDLVGIPWRLAFALQDDGWWLRQDIIWCLSGGTYVYARTQKGDAPVMIRDVARLDPKSVRLWTGQQWTQVLGWSRSHRIGNELEIVLRSGEKISCTPTHRFPVEGWFDEVGKQARHLCVGMKLMRTALPEPASPKDSTQIGTDLAWFVGLYIAEGSRSEDTIQLSGHARETHRLYRVQQIAEMYGGSATCTTSGNKQSIRVYGKILNAAIDQFVSGRTARDKGLTAVCWKYSNRFLKAILDGYLSGDGHWDAKNQRWRIGFTRNYNLERDLRTLAARLDFRLVLNQSTVTYKGKKRPTFRGEIRFAPYNEKKSPNEIIAIRKARCREVYDIGVEDEPHLFALASGVLTHNSKPNPMPESVTDRCTKAHEYIFLMTKNARYFYDQEASLEPISTGTILRLDQKTLDQQEGSDRVPGKTNGRMKAVLRKQKVPSGWVTDPGSHPNIHPDGRTKVGKSGNLVRKPATERGCPEDGVSGNIPWEGMTRNPRSVWTITTKPFTGAHFATFPPEIPEKCIRAGTRPDDTVLYPFAGAGTTLEVAKRLGRKYIGIEINEKYVKELIEPRLSQRELFEKTEG